MTYESGGHLLGYAASKLSPDIFTHPVWVLFYSNKAHFTRDTVENLWNAAKGIQEDEPGSACQILLADAAWLNQVGQHKNALRFVQQALSLAEHAGLITVMTWSVWGAAATCFQDENFEQTARYLAYLQDILVQQKEWVLADFIDIVRQSLPRGDQEDTFGTRESMPALPQDNILAFTFNWLKNWGAPVLPFVTKSGVISRGLSNQPGKQAAFNQDLFPSQNRRGWWHNFKLTLIERLNLNEVDKNSARLGRQLNARNHALATEGSHTQKPGTDPRIGGAARSVSAQRANSAAITKPDLVDTAIPELETERTTLVVQMLGPFSILLQDRPLRLPASRSLSLLKYLLLHHKQDTPREVLMEVFWPESDPDAARNNLNVAMHNLRTTLRSVTDLALIHYEDGAYGLASPLQLWLDVDEFELCVNKGQRLESQNQLNAAVTEYEIAVHLYQGDFLTENPYDGWTVLNRERLRNTYLDILDHLSQIYFKQEHYAICVNTCQLILARDTCREDAHCRLMKCYSRLGQAPLALRQYQICVEALRSELEVDPAPLTSRLYEKIRKHELV